MNSQKFELRLDDVSLVDLDHEGQRLPQNELVIQLQEPDGSLTFFDTFLWIFSTFWSDSSYFSTERTRN